MEQGDRWERMPHEDGAVISRGCAGLSPAPGVRESSALGLEGDSFLCSWGWGYTHYRSACTGLRSHEARAPS